MFRIKHLRINTLSERVIFIHEEAVRTGNLGFRPLDRVRIFEAAPRGESPKEVTGVLNFCEDTLIASDEVGLSIITAQDLGLPEGAEVQATIAPAPSCRFRPS